MLKVGVIGAGAMGQHHVRVYSGLGNVELAGVSDLDEQRLKTLAEKYGVESFTDYGELLKKDLDAVSIAVPTTLHREVSLDAVTRGINVLVEKPIADTMENANLIIKASRTNSVKLMVGHVERFNPAIIALKDHQDELGKIVTISARRVGPYNPRIRDVGIITDLAVHDVDVMSYLYSKKIRSVHAYAGSVNHRFEDYAHILLGFENGNSGSIETNWLTPHKVRQLTVTGTDGIAYVDYIGQTLRICNEKGVNDIDIEKKEPLRNELEHFVKCILEDRDPVVSGEEGIQALKVALAAVKSYKMREVIEFSYRKPLSHYAKTRYVPIPANF